MAGIFGFYPFGEGRENWEAARFIYYGLSALQGRGQETVSLAAFSKPQGFKIVNADGLVDEALKENEAKVPGYLGIGQVSAYEGDYLIEIREPLKLVLAGDGKPSVGDDKREGFRLLAQSLSQTLHKTKDPLEASKKVLQEVGGGYSFIALTEREELICCRDRLGVKPLEVGSVGFDLGLVASESAALDVIGATHSGSVSSGEVVVFDSLSIRRARVERGNPRTAHCTFEYVYLARPDSYINGISVGEARERVGEELAKESPTKGDVVIAVPETAYPFSTSFSKNLGIALKLGFVRTGRHLRTAIKPTQLERLMGVQLKLNPIRSSVEGKDVVLIDDSVVRGNTLKNTVLNLKRKGARKVQVRVGSPAIISHCPFGTEIPPKDELIARALSNEEIAEIVSADSFSFLSTEGLARAIGLPKEKLCMGCFTGTYPEE